MEGGKSIEDLKNMELMRGEYPIDNNMLLRSKTATITVSNQAKEIIQNAAYLFKRDQLNPTHEYQQDNDNNYPYTGISMGAPQSPRTISGNQNYVRMLSQRHLLLDGGYERAREPVTERKQTKGQEL